MSPIMLAAHKAGTCLLQAAGSAEAHVSPECERMSFDTVPGKAGKFTFTVHVDLDKGEAAIVKGHEAP